MKLYSERHGVRAPLKKTYTINRDVYSLLLDCCHKYKKNLTHVFALECHHDFTNRNYTVFDENGYRTRIKTMIPALFYNNDYDNWEPMESDKYDQFALLDLIEFYALKIKDISERWNNEQYRDYQIIDCFNTVNIFKKFQESINELFYESGLLYELNDDKIIERIIENSPLTMEIEKDFAIVTEVGTRELLEDAIALYKTPSPMARQDSVEKIWDALERLKTYYTSMNKKASSKKIIDTMANGNENFIKLFDDEFLSLTSIGNDFRIRHHETNRIDIIDPLHYDYFFNRCLSLIALAVKYLA